MKAYPLFVLSLLLVGCGGGGNGSSPASGPAPTTSFGPVTLEGFVSDAPVRASGSSSSFIGLAGDFSSIVYQNPNPRVEQTQFVYSEGGGIHVLDYDGGNPRQPFSGITPTSMSFSPGGGLLYFSDSNKNLRSGLITGGPATTIGTGEREFGIMNPAGTHLAYYRRSSATGFSVLLSNPDGTGQTTAGSLSSSAELIFDGLAWIGNNQIIYGSRSSLLSTVIGASNGFITDSLPGITTNLQILGSSRDGRVAYVERDGSAGREIVMLTFVPGINAPVGIEQYDINKDILSLSVSPDRRQVVTLEVNEGANPGNVLLVRRNFDLTGAVTVRSLPPDTDAKVVGWQPFPTNRVLAGAASLFGGNASAFVWAASGNEMSGAALVRAQTPSTAKIDAEGASGSNLFYAIECDRITKASISVDKGQAFANIALTSTTNGILVNFNGASGEVMAAMPYAVTRGSGKPKITRQGDRILIEGAVQGVYDAKGKNLAPEGATRVVLIGDRVEVGR